MQIDGDIYQLAGTNFEETCVCTDISANIHHADMDLDPAISVRVPRGGTVTITPQQPNLTLSPGFEYEIRSPTSGKCISFKPSSFGVAIEHGDDFTIIKTA